MSSSSDARCGLLVLVAMCGSLLTACGHEPVRRLPTTNDAPARDPAQQVNRSAGERAAVIALRQIGVPYQYGGVSRNGFDCSGLVRYSYGVVGTAVPRSTSDQWKHFTPISRSRLEIGDVLFFRIDGSISHVGIYLGDDRFVHAPSSGRSVSVASLDSRFYRKAFVRGGRP